jgi:hypothetical protein
VIFVRPSSIFPSPRFAQERLKETAHTSISGRKILAGAMSRRVE